MWAVDKRSTHAHKIMEKMALLHNNLLSDYVTASTHNPHAPTITTPAQGLQNRPVWSNRHPPVAVYRTGLTGNR